MLTNANPSRLGAANLGSDAEALFLKVFSGEVITTFEQANVMMPLHRVRTIQSGKSATFPVTGVASAAYHTPGESILATPSATVTGFTSPTAGAATSGSSVIAATSASTSKYLSRFKHNEKIVYIDDILVSSVFVADIDEMKNHYDVRSIYSTEIGRQLAYVADKNLIRSVIAGARKSTDRFGGSSTDYLGAQIAIGASPDGDSVLAGLLSAAQKFDERNVPEGDRFAILPPSMYYLLVNSNKDAINRDYNTESNGSVASGTVMSVGGIRLFKSNHVPTANESSSQDAIHGSDGVKNDVIVAGDNKGYSGLNYTATRGIVFQREALATVKLLDLSLETDYITERMGTLMLAKYAMGHNVLREEACFELTAA